MPPATPITRQTAGRTFLIAISVLGLGAMVQFGAICWTFIARYRSAEPAATEAPIAVENTDVEAEVRPAPVPASPADFSADPLAGAPTPAAPAAAVLPKPTPVMTQQPTLLDPTTAGRFEELMAQGKLLSERGDTGNALTRFREAQALDPRNPLTFSEIALTYEKMGLTDRANEQWKRLYDMGSAAGPLFIAAKAKLQTAQVTELNKVMSQVPNTAAAADAGGAVVRGAPLLLSEIKMSEMRDPAASKKFALQVPIRKRFGSAIDANDLVIQVHFYDVVDSARVERTGANVSYRWQEPPPDWAEGETEELIAQYDLPVEKRNRKYFGYLVRLYYKGELQASAGAPDSLVQKYPAPPTLQNDPIQ